MSTRRDIMKSILAGAATGAALPATALSRGAGAHSQDKSSGSEPTWARGIEGQRRADLGNGTFLNPIVPGDHPDPTILKDGDDYYMTFSPIVRTRDASERWWSRGHASLVEGPGGRWWMVYHGYENGYHTLGRQTLLDPVEWTEDGWFRALGGDLSQPIRKPKGGRPSEAGIPLSDDFSTNKFGLQWSFHAPGREEMARVRYEPKALVVSGKGAGPQDCSPFGFIAGDHAYEVSVGLEPRNGAQGGVLLFYNEHGFVGLGYDGHQILTFNYSQEHSWLRIPIAADRLYLRLTNDRHIVTMHYGADGQTWKRHPWRHEVSGYHQNVFGGFLSLRPALYACGTGDVRYTDFRYRAF